jgi:hypothetical protein
VIQRLRSPWLALAALALIGCSQGAEPDAEPPPPGTRARTISVHMSLETTDVLGLDESMRALAEREGGYVERVPAERLPAFRRAARRLGDVTGESQLIEDAGERRTERARLRSARTDEERLLALLSDRNATPADAIAIEERLANVRATIDQLESEDATLEHRIEYASVQIDVARTSVAFWAQPWETIGSAASAGLSVARAILVGIAVAIVALGPTALMFGLALASLIAAIRFLTRRRRAIAT